MIDLDLNKVKAAAMVLRALKNPLREKMLVLIDENPGITVTGIYVKMRLEQSVASQHLAILRESSIVRTEREGKSIRYYAAYDTIKAISSLVDELATLFK